MVKVKKSAAVGKKIKTKNYKEFFKLYVDGKIKLEKYQKVGVILLVIVFSGMIGWFWEFALAEIGGHFEHLYIKGGNLLPWMNIYAYGALAIILVSYKLKKYPWAVFLASTIVCGALELFAGWVVYTVGDGTRYWDYTNAWFGWGNINGFVCPASAAAFGIGALLLIYWLLPKVQYMATKMTKRAFLTLSITLFAVIMVDDITNLTLKNLGLPTAHNLYQALGWVYKS